ncbi:MAG: hypothetical protein ACJAYB_000095 [Psychromonas sp.]|jgi:hypothetical protein
MSKATEWSDYGQVMFEEKHWKQVLKNRSAVGCRGNGPGSTEEALDKLRKAREKAAFYRR